MFPLDIALSSVSLELSRLSRLSRLRLYLLNFASVNSTEEFDNSLTVFTGAGFVASGVALWNIAVVEPLDIFGSAVSLTTQAFPPKFHPSQS